MLKKILALMVIIYIARANELDPLFTPQRTFYSAVQKSLGDAGLANPSDITTGLLNPAMVYSYQKSSASAHGSAAVGFGRDSLYNRAVIPIGFSYANKSGAIALFYRYMSNDLGSSNHEAVLNFSGQMSGKSDQQGAVDFGVNFKYEYCDWIRTDLYPLSITRSIKDTSGNWVNDSIVGTMNPPFRGSYEENRFLIDIGFYQSNIADGLDFGLVVKNLLGYRLIREQPDIITHDSIYAGTEQDDSIDSLRDRTQAYGTGSHKSKKWVKGAYRTIGAGITYNIELANGNFALCFPADMEIIGLFDKKIKNKFVFHGGVQGKISRNFYLRLGYSRAPLSILTDLTQIKNVNIFTGGAGISISPVTLDFYISNNAFGFTSNFDY